MEWVIFLLVGSLAGFSAGLLGIGGGLITVPALVLILPTLGFSSDDVMHIAIATSLAAIVPTALLSAYKHNTHQSINWHFAGLLFPGLVLGSVLGVIVAVDISRVPLQIFFSLFLIIVSFYMFFGQPVPQPASTSNKVITRLTSIIIGAISALLGVGGGTMTVPFLVWRGLKPQVAVGTSAFCGIPIALTAVLVFIITASIGSINDLGSFIHWQALLFIILGSMLFTPLGANFAHQLSTDKLKRIFAILLIFVSIELILDVI